jgi:hypothetical protein
MNGSNIALSSNVIGVIDSHSSKLENFKLTTGKSKVYNSKSDIILNNSFYFKSSFDFQVKLPGAKIIFNGETILKGDPKSTLNASIFADGQAFSEPIVSAIPKKKFNFDQNEKNFILICLTNLKKEINFYLMMISEEDNKEFCFGKYIDVLQGYLHHGDNYLSKQKISNQKESLGNVISALRNKAERKEFFVGDGKKKLIVYTLLSFSYLIMELIRKKYPNSLDTDYIPTHVEKILKEIPCPTKYHLFSSLLYNSEKYPLIEIVMKHFDIKSTNILEFNKKCEIKIPNTKYSVNYHKKTSWNMPATFYDKHIKEWEFEKIEDLSSHVKILTFDNDVK